MTKKLKLVDLKVQSFNTTNKEQMVGGAADSFKLTQCAMPGGCTWYCTGTGAC